MSDGAQRLLDVIDDPNALESFLGGLTSDSELLPSADSVDNVVASLARSLEGDYEVDSPNETLFDTLEASSNNLTDISQSYVPSDFDNVNVANINSHGTYNSSMGSLQNGEMSHLQQQDLQNSLSTVITSRNEQFIISGNQSINSTSNITTSLQQQFSSTNSNCDSSSLVSSSNFVQQNQQIQLNQTQQLLLQNNGNNTSYVFRQDLMQKQNILNQPQQQQTNNLSSSNIESQNQSSSSSLNNMISVSLSNNASNSGQIMTSGFHQMNEISQQGQTVQVINQGQQVTLNSNLNPNSTSVSSSTSSNNDLSNVTGNSNNNLNNTSTQTQQYTTNATPQQTATVINQLGQTVGLANVGGAQIIANSGNIMTTGQAQANIIQQIQSANSGQSYITVDQSTGLISTGHGGFGGANLALMATGGTPTYTMVPSGAQFLSNAIMGQQQTIQTLTKGPNGTYFQTTTGGAQIVTTQNVNQVQNVSVANTNTNTKPKQPPQLLPKPGKNSNNIGSSTSNSETVSSSTPSIVTSANNITQGVNTQTEQGVVTQIFQQQQAQIQGLQNQVVVTSMGNVTIPQQQSFTIGNAGLGQVVVSQNPNQQTQLTGTIVVNQYGQPMLLPSSSTGQTGGVQFILRQQPTQSQVLTIQAPTQQQAQTVQGKNIVRYLSQVPQVAQTSGYGIQQIQTPTGPAWVAVRYPQPATSAGHFTQLDTNTIIQQGQITNQPQQIQIVHQAHQQQPTPSPSPQPHNSQQPLTPQQQSQPLTPQPLSQPMTPQSYQPSTPQPPSTPPTVQHQKFDNPDSSSEPPPAKKSKSRAKPKKKVCLDLEQLLKQSGIMEEDLTDFGDFGFGSSQENGFDSSSIMDNTDVHTTPEEVPHNPVQLPIVNTSGKSKSKNQGVSPKRSPSKSKKKKAPEKRKSPSPPPLPPPPSSKSKSKKKGGNQKADMKTDNYNSNNKIEGQKKTSSIDSVTATIMAVAAGDRIETPPPSPSPQTPSKAKPTTPKSRSPSKQSKTSKAQPNQPQQQPTSNTGSITLAPQQQQQQMFAQSPVPVPVPSPVLGVTLAGGMGMPNGVNSPAPSSQAGTRIVQTIQLTPQNQQLLRNIQVQISRLLSLSKRNDTEQTALQKLIVLQQQVIATGIPVPNPSNLNHLTQSVNANVSATLLAASTASSTAAAVSAIVGGIPETVISTSTSTSSSNPTVSLSQNNIVSINLPNSQSNINNAQKFISPKPPNTTTTTANNKSNNTTVFTPTDTGSSADNVNEGALFQALSGGVSKVAMLTAINNVNTEPNSGVTEENKENTMGSSTMVVASSNFTTTTNTTNSLGQHHLQSFPSPYRNAIDDKKAEEQRTANHKAEEEKRARWKKEEFEMLLKRDQQCVVKPDYEIPFCSKRDAVERLMKYHILRDRNDMSFEEFDTEFGEKASLLLDKFHGMVAKHRSLLMKESMKEVGCAERVMLERMFVSEEKSKLEQDRLLVSQGEILELPPPPSCWVPKIQDMVDKEMKEMERDSYVNQQVQSAIDSIIGFGNNEAIFLPEEGDKIEYDSFGVPINNGANGGMNSASSADIDEAVRSILF